MWYNLICVLFLESLNQLIFLETFVMWFYKRLENIYFQRNIAFFLNEKVFFLNSKVIWSLLAGGEGSQFKGTLKRYICDRIYFSFLSFHYKRILKTGFCNVSTFWKILNHFKPFFVIKIGRLVKNTQNADFACF